MAKKTKNAQPAQTDAIEIIEIEDQEAAETLAKAMKEHLGAPVQVSKVKGAFLLSVVGADERAADMLGKIADVALDLWECGLASVDSDDDDDDDDDNDDNEPPGDFFRWAGGVVDAVAGKPAARKRTRKGGK